MPVVNENANLTKASGTGIEAVPDLPKCRIQVFTKIITLIYPGTYPTAHTLGIFRRLDIYFDSGIGTPVALFQGL